jgi:hypothetical protein
VRAAFKNFSCVSTTNNDKTTKPFSSAEQVKSPTSAAAADKTFVEDGSEKAPSLTPPKTTPDASKTTEATQDTQTGTADEDASEQELKNPHLAWHTN